MTEPETWLGNIQRAAQCGQMSDTTLRTRIAKVLYTRAMSRLSWHRNWDDLQPEVQQMWLDDADAVIHELNLREDYSYPPSRRRYVTDWEPAE